MLLKHVLANRIWRSLRGNLTQLCEGSNIMRPKIGKAHTLVHSISPFNFDNPHINNVWLSSLLRVKNLSFVILHTIIKLEPTLNPKVYFLSFAQHLSLMKGCPLQSIDVKLIL